LRYLGGGGGGGGGGGDSGGLREAVSARDARSPASQVLYERYFRPTFDALSSD